MSDFNFKSTLSLSPPKVNVSWKNPLLRARTDLALLKGMREGARMVGRELDTGLDKAMDASIWGWGATTLRRNGSIVSSPRNIVDTGQLKSSKQVKYAQYPGSTAFSINYTAPYAKFVHFGGMMQPYGNKNAASVLVPARPWVEAVLYGTYGMEKLPLKEIYGRAIRDAWSAI